MNSMATTLNDWWILAAIYTLDLLCVMLTTLNSGSVLLILATTTRRAKQTLFRG